MTSVGLAHARPNEGMTYMVCRLDYIPMGSLTFIDPCTALWHKAMHCLKAQGYIPLHGKVAQKCGTTALSNEGMTFRLNITHWRADLNLLGSTRLPNKFRSGLQMVCK